MTLLQLRDSVYDASCVFTGPWQGRLARNSHDVSGAVQRTYQGTNFVQRSHSPGKLGNFVDDQGKVMCIIRVAWLFFCWKMKYTFSACYDKIVMERSLCRGGGAD